MRKERYILIQNKQLFTKATPTPDEKEKKMQGKLKTIRTKTAVD